MSEELVHRLRALAGAYPEDIFGPVTKEEREAHPGLITRNSAAMGRHLGQFFIEAADAIERLERDHLRYEYLRRLNVPQFQALFCRCIDEDRRFDDLVDEAVQQSSQVTEEKR